MLKKDMYNMDKKYNPGYMGNIYYVEINIISGVSV